MCFYRILPITDVELLLHDKKQERREFKASSLDHKESALLIQALRQRLSVEQIEKIIATKPTPYELYDFIFNQLDYLSLEVALIDKGIITDLSQFNTPLTLRHRTRQLLQLHGDKLTVICYP